MVHKILCKLGKDIIFVGPNKENLVTWQKKLCFNLMAISSPYIKRVKVKQGNMRCSLNVHKYVMKRIISKYI